MAPLGWFYYSLIPGALRDFPAIFVLEYAACCQSSQFSSLLSLKPYSKWLYFWQQLVRLALLLVW